MSVAKEKQDIGYMVQSADKKSLWGWCDLMYDMVKENNLTSAAKSIQEDEVEAKKEEVMKANVKGVQQMTDTWH